MKMESTGRSAAAIGLIGLGVLFLLAQYIGFSFLGTLWPLFVMLPGLAFLYFAYTGDQRHAGLAIPGAMITGTGAILFYQNLTGHWTSWAYIWALYPVFLGFAFVFMGRRTGDRHQIMLGDNFVKWGLFGFVVLWAFFELLIFGGNSPLISTIVPLALIAAGIYILTRGRRVTTYGPRKSKWVNGHGPSYDSDLQDKINAALSEDDQEIV